MISTRELMCSIAIDLLRRSAIFVREINCVCRHSSRNRCRSFDHACTCTQPSLFFAMSVVLRLALFASAAVGCSGACLEFQAGLCPGDADCMCTTGAACAAPDAPKKDFLTQHQHHTSSMRGSKTPVALLSCPGQCRKVAHNECPGSSSCLNDIGPCDAPPTPSSGPSGPDVSNWQGSIDWGAVAGAGASFAFMKATEGTGYVDVTFADNWANSRAAGIAVRGAYHFGHPGADVSAQAQLFAKVVGTVGPGDLVVLDIEDATSVAAAGGHADGGGGAGGGNATAKLMSPSDVAAWCTAFLDEVTSLTGLPASRVLVYTGAWFWDPQVGGASMGEHPLWVSGYTSSPPMPQGWDAWTFWQCVFLNDCLFFEFVCFSSQIHPSRESNRAPVLAYLSTASCLGNDELAQSKPCVLCCSITRARQIFYMIARTTGTRTSSPRRASPEAPRTTPCSRATRRRCGRSQGCEE
jgi:lysozyme